MTRRSFSSEFELESVKLAVEHGVEAAQPAKQIPRLSVGGRDPLRGPAGRGKPVHS